MLDHKTLSFGALAILTILALLGVLTFLLISGVTSAIQARDGFQSLQEQLSSGGLAELADPDSDGTLSAQFSNMERSAGQARSRLRFTALFTWVPVIGGRIRDSRAHTAA